ncbi:MAG: hypothetical protein O3A20_09695 [Planctomycetota bacterium]|nr:hypothetical protein [Planctomycetota bacterium]
MIYPFAQRLLAGALTASLLSLAACGGSGTATVGGGSGSGGGGGGGGGGAGTTYLLSDLEGDWIGQLQPSALGAWVRNVYLRFANGELMEAAESDGGEWTDAAATMGFAFNSKGVLKTDLQADLGSSRLLVSGQMDPALASISGSFTVRSSTGQKVTGSFIVSRSSGVGQFDQDMLTGRWDGLGQGSSGQFRYLKFELDASGTLVDGLLRHPDTAEKIRNYSAGAASFSFFDSSIGRLENVVITADGGHTITFDFLLLDIDGTLLAGPGEESGLGVGIAELMRGI